MKNKEDVTGRKFGLLTAICFSYIKRTNQFWKFQCDCGKIKIMKLSSVKYQNKSCGCINSGRFVKKHGLSLTKIYKAWSHMIDRCYKQKAKGYKNYGGRGISVCEEWKNNFQAFYDWSIINGYQDDLTIDRINNDGNYCPENCRWITIDIQSNNKSDNHYITFNGKTQTLTQWSHETNIKQPTIRQRLKRGWSIEKSLTTQLLRK